MCHNQDHPALSILKDCLAREVGKKSWHSQRMMADLSEAIALILAPPAAPVRVTREWVQKEILDALRICGREDIDIVCHALREKGIIVLDGEGEKK